MKDELGRKTMTKFVDGSEDKKAKDCWMLIAFDGMIFDMLINKNVIQ